MNATDAIKYLHDNFANQGLAPDSHFVLIFGNGLTRMSGANLLQLLLQLKQMRRPAYTDWPGAFEKQGCDLGGYDRRQPDV